jgi:hypothetical protein
MNAAVAELDAHDAHDCPSICSIAKKHGVDRTTLSRQWKGIQRSSWQYHEDVMKISPLQEVELVKHIQDLTRRRLQPTRSMISNYAEAVAGVEVLPSWITRFLNRHNTSITNRWTTAMDSVRHAANLYEKYNCYFNLLNEALEEYNILPQNIYNMDEKGFMLGKAGRSKRVFDRDMWITKEVRQSLQDGSREWVALVGAICADGTSLPPALLFASKSSELQESWVAHINSNNHEVYVGATESSWSNNKMGLKWLVVSDVRYYLASSPGPIRNQCAYAGAPPC